MIWSIIITGFILLCIIHDIRGEETRRRTDKKRFFSITGRIILTAK
jgi:hypothetical protein